MTEREHPDSPLTETAIGPAAEARTDFLPDEIRNVETPLAWEHTDDLDDDDVVDYPPTGGHEWVATPDELRRPWGEAWVQGTVVLVSAVIIALAVGVVGWAWVTLPHKDKPATSSEADPPALPTTSPKAAAPSEAVQAPTTTITVQAAPPASSETPTFTPTPGWDVLPPPPDVPHPPGPGDPNRIGTDTDPDMMYFDDLALFNISVPDPQRAMMLGHWACQLMAGGNAFANTRVGAANRMQQTFGFNNISDYTSTSIVSAATFAYCPQYEHK